jgi:hypothetical protein
MADTLLSFAEHIGHAEVDLLTMREQAPMIARR